MERVQGMLVPEGVGAALIAVVASGAREGRRVHLAEDRRREREQELLAEMVSGVTEGGGERQVHHGGAAGAWSLTGIAAVGGTARGEASVAGGAPVPGRTVATRRRR
ncbi:hypothetical protein [Streptomyces peucetius]|nr:hypothetical protein CGZ69_00085 [Streptomyces peucetius subsp. caesius ATCC 27952]